MGCGVVDPPNANKVKKKKNNNNNSCSGETQTQMMIDNARSIFSFI
jgi:hypothetical protein